MPALYFTLGNPYDPYWPGIPPHMLTDDLPVWNDFRKRFEKDFKTFYYDVALSIREPPATAITPSLVALWKKTWGKRIDVIGIKDNEVWIIEVTTGAYLRTIGQILTYYQLWKVDPPLKAPFTPYIVCRYIDEDVAFTCEQYGIKWMVL